MGIDEGAYDYFGMGIQLSQAKREITEELRRHTAELEKARIRTADMQHQFDRLIKEATDRGERQRDRAKRGLWRRLARWWSGELSKPENAKLAKTSETPMERHRRYEAAAKAATPHKGW